MHEPQSTMSKAELRKTHKPIMEKRRRARINHCLNEIKSLILEAMNKDPARHSKLEKADILEMAVKHLQNTQRQQLALAMSADPTVLRKFKSGFNECSQEIDKYINSLEGVDPSMKQRISTHLHKCINGIEQLAHFNFPGLNNLPFLTNTSNLFGNKKVVAETVTIGDQNNNPRIQIPPGIQLIPSRLPSGELALLVPNSSNLPYFSQNSYTNRNSAFSPVHPQSNNESKPLSPPMSPIQIHEDKSPKAFKPVVKYHSDDHQVPQISSTGELKTIQFPINKNLTSPKKIVEPLCIITNQSERYKQAKLIDETAFYEENLPRSQNIKTNNLLTIADSTISQQNKSTTDNPKSESASTSKNLDSSDMWRPW